MPSFKKSLIVEQFQGNYLNIKGFFFLLRLNTRGQRITTHRFWILVNKTHKRRQITCWRIWYLVLCISLKLAVNPSVWKANPLLFTQPRKCPVSKSSSRLLKFKTKSVYFDKGFSLWQYANAANFQ